MRVILLSSMLVCSGCIFTSDSDGGLELRWTIGAGVQSCEEAGLDLVEITLEEEGGDILGPYTAACEAGLGDLFVVDGVDEGTYTIIIDGYAGDELVYSGRSQQRYEVEADRMVRAETVVLSPIPATIVVLWRFEDGRQCGFHDVDELIIRAFLNNAIADTISTFCAEGEATFEEVLPGSYDVQVTALDDTSGDAAYRFTEASIAVAAGDEATVDGIFLPCEEPGGGCL